MGMFTFGISKIIEIGGPNPSSHTKSYVPFQMYEILV